MTPTAFCKAKLVNGDIVEIPHMKADALKMALAEQPPNKQICTKQGAIVLGQIAFMCYEQQDSMFSFIPEPTLKTLRAYVEQNGKNYLIRAERTHQGKFTISPPTPMDKRHS